MNDKLQFASQQWGYDINQVDGYLLKLTEEYKNLFHKYEILVAGNESRAKEAEAQGTQTTAKAAHEPAIKGGRAMDDAKNAAAVIIEQANSERARIEQDRNRLIDEIILILDGLKKNEFIK